MLPTAILFDLDDTILCFEPRIMSILETVTQHRDTLIGVDAQAMAQEIDDNFDRLWLDALASETWRHNLAEAYGFVITEFFRPRRAQDHDLTPEFALQFAQDLYERRQKCEPISFPGAIETLDELKASGVKLALITNGPGETQRAKVNRFDLARRFDHVQIEGEIGFGKPTERAYRHAMEILGVEPHETWMVGDNLEWEVAAPQRLGIFAIWNDFAGEGLPEHTDVVPDRIIRSIKELL